MNEKDAKEIFYYEDNKDYLNLFSSLKDFS